MLWKKGRDKVEDYSVTEPPNLVDKELDFLAAIEAHVRWKIRLESYIAGTCDEELEAETACKDDECLLGKWIYGAGGEKYNELDKFQYIKETHTNFHRCAGDVIRMVDNGQTDEARELLLHGEYSTYSHRIKSELARLSLELDYKK
ncbi:MAG: CZB domain-containing protein [Gammaproteobacteria bacterium]|nr:CZB domain-containing protein [Gammaproteobacteria bacterium]